MLGYDVSMFFQSTGRMWHPRRLSWSRLHLFFYTAVVLKYQTNENEPIWSDRQLSLGGALVFHMSAQTVSCWLYLTMLLYLTIGSGQLHAHVENRNKDAVSEQVPSGAGVHHVSIQTHWFGRCCVLWEETRVLLAGNHPWIDIWNY